MRGRLRFANPTAYETVTVGVGSVKVSGEPHNCSGRRPYATNRVMIRRTTPGKTHRRAFNMRISSPSLVGVAAAAGRLPCHSASVGRPLLHIPTGQLTSFVPGEVVEDAFGQVAGVLHR
jgi:hypothetical protein